MTFPITAIGGTASHRAQQVWIDRNDFLNGLTGNVRAHGRTGIDRYNDSGLEFERQRRGAFGKLNGLVFVARPTHGTEIGSTIQGGLNNNMIENKKNVAEERFWGG